MANDNEIERYSDWDRKHHSLIAVTFILAAISGFALFYPLFFPLSYALGGPTWSRILHPFIGVVMAWLFYWAAKYLYHHNHITDGDREWLRRIGTVMRGKTEGLPEVGKYNAGQKIVFWTQVYGIGVMLVTGIVIWQPWFAPYFPTGVTRIAVLLHSVAAVVLMAALIVHAYAAIWVKGTLQAMTKGTVTRAWAKTHHPGWYKHVMSKGAK